MSDSLSLQEKLMTLIYQLMSAFERSQFLRLFDSLNITNSPLYLTLVSKGLKAVTAEPMKNIWNSYSRRRDHLSLLFASSAVDYKL